MSDFTVAAFEAALARHASSRGEVFPSAIGLIEAEEHWTGRLWDVARLVMHDQETMRYVAGGNRPDEVAACVAGWSESTLNLDEMKMVIEAGGYDPDPFEPLAKSGHLGVALYDHGEVRQIHGERAGAWISDQMALSSDGEVVSRVLEAIGGTEVMDESLAPERR
jgi:hypothetical protein